MLGLGFVLHVLPFQTLASLLGTWLLFEVWPSGNNMVLITVPGSRPVQVQPNILLSCSPVPHLHCSPP